jgi:hypothetical protein
VAATLPRSVSDSDRRLTYIYFATHNRNYQQRRDDFGRLFDVFQIPFTCDDAISRRTDLARANSAMPMPMPIAVRIVGVVVIVVIAKKREAVEVAIAMMKSAAIATMESAGHTTMEAASSEATAAEAATMEAASSEATAAVATATAATAATTTTTSQRYRWRSQANRRNCQQRDHCLTQHEHSPSEISHPAQQVAIDLGNRYSR